MTLFRGLYDRVLEWSRHPHAERYLAGLSFAESSFFPIPPDVMLAPMTLAKPSRAWRFALLTTVASVAGGIAGYAIGYFALTHAEPLILDLGYGDAYDTVKGWFAEWGFWAVFIAGFSPVPYKLFTIAAGAVAMPLAPFALASTVGRGARFFLVAGLIKAGGPEFEAKLRRHIDLITIVTVVAGVIVLWMLNG